MSVSRHCKKSEERGEARQHHLLETIRLMRPGGVQSGWENRGLRVRGVFNLGHSRESGSPLFSQNHGLRPEELLDGFYKEGSGSKYISASKNNATLPHFSDRNSTRLKYR